MALIYLYKSLGLSKDITFLDGSGDTIVPGASDKIRAIIGREGRLGTDYADAELVVTSDGPTNNGSSFSKNTPDSGTNRLRIDAEDCANIKAGAYTLMIDLYDNADAQEWKNVSRQVLVVEET